MKNSFHITSVNSENLTEHPQAICFINPKNENYKLKVNWLKKRFNEGLVIKLLFPVGSSRAVGFIEYTPGKYAWRSVSADDYLFINCLWVFSNKDRNKGIGSLLLQDCFKEAEKNNYSGTAVITSEGSFMADKDLFLKNGFSVIETSKPYSLLANKIKDTPLPSFCNWQENLKKYRGLNIIYTLQCPWVARSIAEFKKYSEENNIRIKFKEMKTAEEVRKSPSIYSSFNLVFNGKLLADHYVSLTRFTNILRQNSII